jgi:integrase
MKLSDIAETYVKQHGLKARTIAANARRFEKLTGITEPERISTAVLTAFRQTCLAIGLSNVTTEKTVTDVMTVVRHATGTRIECGRRLRQIRPTPSPFTPDEVDAVFRAAESERLRRWIVLAYWTGLRLCDSVRLYWTLRGPCEVIRFTAQKTGTHHVFPVRTWLHAFMKPVEPHTGYCTEWFAKLIRTELAESCERAGVKPKTPKNLRQASITEWSMANATAGRLIHGCGLGVMSNYLDPLMVLESAAPRVRLPACFGGTQSQSTEEALISSFRRLDPQSQGLVSGMTDRLAAG